MRRFLKTDKMQKYTVYTVYTGQKHCKYKIKTMKSFLTSTCLSLLENLDEQLLDIEYTRVKHLDTVSTKTRSKPTNSNNKDFLRSLLLQSESDVNQAHQSLQATILDALQSITSRDRTTCKDVATSTRDDASPLEISDLEENIMMTPPTTALSVSRPVPSCNDIQTQKNPPKERPPLGATRKQLKSEERHTSWKEFRCWYF